MEIVAGETWGQALRNEEAAPTTNAHLSVHSKGSVRLSSSGNTIQSTTPLHSYIIVSLCEERKLPPHRQQEQSSAQP